MKALIHPSPGTKPYLILCIVILSISGIFLTLGFTVLKNGWLATIAEAIGAGGLGSSIGGFVLHNRALKDAEENIAE